MAREMEEKWGRLLDMDSALRRPRRGDAAEESATLRWAGGGRVKRTC